MADVCQHEEVWKGLCVICGASVELDGNESHTPIVGGGMDVIGLQMHREVRRNRP